MFAKILFALIFLSQITLVSVVLPAKLIRSLRSALIVEGRNILKRERSQTPSFLAYRLANSFATIMGLGLLGAIFYYNVIDQITVTLAFIGLYFLLQFIPLALLDVRHFGADPAPPGDLPDEKTASRYRSLRFFQATSPLVAGFALLLVIAYLWVQFAAWGGRWDTHLLQIAIFVLVNLFVVGVIMSGFATLRKAEINSVATQRRAVLMTANLLTFVSIMISIYYFSKEAIFLLDLDRFRPAMMSTFLHLPALLLFNALFFGEHVRKG